VNDFLNDAVEKVKSIIISYRVERERMLREIEKFRLNKEIVNMLKGGKCYVKET
jgi:guanylate kinase